MKWLDRIIAIRPEEASALWDVSATKKPAAGPLPPPADVPVAWHGPPCDRNRDRIQVTGNCFACDRTWCWKTRKGRKPQAGEPKRKPRLMNGYEGPPDVPRRRVVRHEASAVVQRPRCRWCDKVEVTVAKNGIERVACTLGYFMSTKSVNTTSVRDEPFCLRYGPRGFEWADE